MTQRIFTLACLLSAGCRFGVAGLDGGGAANVDGAADARPAADAAPADASRLDAGDGGSRNLGAACASASQCDSGFCVDGFCCDELCDPLDPGNLCKACNVPGLEGQCVLEPAGLDARDQCAADDPATCGHDGTCDGAGACRLWPAGSACGAQTCVNDVATYAPACDGNGTCVMPPPTAPCAPYVCADATSCYMTCTDNSQCQTGQVCQSGSCGKRANGQPCAGNSDCGSGQCAQGVCCGSACGGVCFACNLAGKEGTCSPVAAGQDPLNQCAAQTRGSCGRDGACNGAGACRLWASGTVCAAAGCQGDSVVTARTCDGSGTCSLPVTTSCGSYSCNPSTGRCYTSCSMNSQCASGLSCKQVNGKCM
jgi:hypothetical protein